MTTCSSLSDFRSTHLTPGLDWTTGAVLSPPKNEMSDSQARMSGRRVRRLPNGQQRRAQLSQTPAGRVLISPGDTLKRQGVFTAGGVGENVHSGRPRRSELFCVEAPIPCLLVVRHVAQDRVQVGKLRATWIRRDGPRHSRLAQGAGLLHQGETVPVVHS